MSVSRVRAGFTRRFILLAGTGLGACVGDVVEPDTHAASPSAFGPGSGVAAQGFVDGGTTGATQVDAASPNLAPRGTLGSSADAGAGVLGGAADAGSASATPSTVVPPACVDEDLRFARGVAIAEVAAYQVVKVPLVTDGQLVTTRAAPLVQGKKALVRVKVRPLTGFSARTLRAVLYVEGSTPKRLTKDMMVTRASTDEAADSSFNFELEAASVGADTTLRALLVETSCSGSYGSAADVTAPKTGSAGLSAESIRKLHVKLVPTIINGNTAMPTDAQIARFREAMLAYYPVPDVAITVHEPYDLSGVWNCSSGDSWSCALDAIVSLRARAADEAADTYYYALLNPAQTLRQYCGTSACTLGVAYASNTVSTRYQVGIGVGYANDVSYDTMVHELGHAHGLKHAPCDEIAVIDPSSIDATFPSSSGNIGDWGWDSRTSAFHPPTHKDIMSYCDPHWISGYNYAAIAKRSARVNISARILAGSVATSAGTAIEHRNLIVSDTAANWGELREVGTPPGDALWADVLDHTGAVVERVLVYRAELSNTRSTFLFVPPLPETAVQLRVDGRNITLPTN
jgi:hypothetical protein